MEYILMFLQKNIHINLMIILMVILIDLFFLDNFLLYEKVELYFLLFFLIYYQHIHHYYYHHSYFCMYLLKIINLISLIK